MVSEFYRADTLERHHLHDTFEFFSDREIPTIMWSDKWRAYVLKK